VRLTGYVLITIGFLAGALASVQSEANKIEWAWFVPAFLLGVVGVVLARVATRQASRNADAMSTNLSTLTRSIDRIVERIGQLNEEKSSMHPNDVHTRIDELFPEDLQAFAEARESIGHAYGLPAYARVMNEFAAGERYLDRVWSASVDCYIEDVMEYLERARDQFTRTQQELVSLQNRA